MDGSGRIVSPPESISEKGSITVKNFLFFKRYGKVKQDEQAVLEEINILKSNDKDAALTKLKKYINEFPDFIWLKHELVKLYALIGEDHNASVISRELFLNDPADISTWAHYHRFNSQDPLYKQHIDQILVSFVDKGLSIDQEWKARLFVQIAIISANKYVIKDKKHFDQIKRFDFNYNFLLDIIIFNYNIKNEVAQQINSSVTCWTICISDTAEVAYIKENVLYINLSKINILDLNCFDDLIMGSMCNFFSLTLKSIPFLNDYGIKSFQSKDACFINQRYLFIKLHQHLILDARIKKINKKINKTNIRPKELYVRAGSIELHAISSYLYNPNHANSILKNIIPYLLEHKIDITSFRDKNWWPRNNFLESLINLMTNAGWYFKNGCPVDTFRDFMEHYLSGLESGYLISTCLSELQILSPHFKTDSNKILSWSAEDFFEKIKNKNILFLTPYADQINESYNSGRLTELYKEHGLELNFNIKCIEAQVTTFPNEDDDSWSQTYLNMKNKVDKILDSNDGLDIFIASCGCYGIPITSYVNKKHSLTSIYYGHIMNFYFGIMTKAFANYKLNNIVVNNFNNWTEGNLEKKYSGLQLIDSGRYASN